MTKYRFTAQEVVEFAKMCYQQAKTQFNNNRLIDVPSFNAYLSEKLGKEVIADGTNFNFRGMFLACANFSDSILDGADFTRANVISTNFTRASLNQANFMYAEMQDMPNFTGAAVKRMSVYKADIGYGEKITAPNRQKLARLRPGGAINSVPELIADFDAGKLPVHANYFHVAVEAEKKEPKQADKLQEIARTNEEAAIAMQKEHEIKAAAHLVPVIREVTFPGGRQDFLPMPAQLNIVKRVIGERFETSILSDQQYESLIVAVLNNKTLVTEDVTLAATALKEAEQPKQQEAKAENGKGCQKEERSFRQKVSSKFRRSHKKEQVETSAPVNDNAQEKQVFATAMDKKIWDILNGQEQRQGRVMGAE